MFQFYNLIPSLTARENVALVTEIADRPLRPEDALALVGLGERHRPLSGAALGRRAAARRDRARDRQAARRAALRRADRRARLRRPASSCSRSSSAIEPRARHDDGRDHPQRRRSPAWPTASSRCASGHIVRRCDAQRRRRLLARRARVVIGALTGSCLRDLVHLRGQVVAIALVVACGVAVVVTSRASYESLADLAVDLLRRVPLRRRLREPQARAREPARAHRRDSRRRGGGDAHRRGGDARRAGPRGARDRPSRSRVPERRVPILNDLHLRSGRWLEPGRRDEVMASEAFANANGLQVGGTIGAVHQRPLAGAAHRRDRALARVRLRDPGRRPLPRQQALRRALDRPRRARRRRSRWRARSTTSRSALTAGASQETVIERRRQDPRALRRPRRVRPRRPDLGPLPLRRDRAAARLGHDDPGDLPRRRGVPAQRRALAADRDAARPDRRAEGVRLQRPRRGAPLPRSSR